MQQRRIGRGHEGIDDSDDNFMRNQHYGNLEAIKQSDAKLGAIMRDGADAGFQMQGANQDLQNQRMQL